MMKKRLGIVLTILSILLISAGCTSNSAKTTKNNDESETKEVNLYLVRHGKTIFNTMDRVQGWSDTPLTDAGVAVAEDLGRGLSDKAIDYMYSSDLGRARETAQIVLDKSKHSDVEIVTSSKLREMCYGSFVGEKNHVMYEALAKEYGVDSVEKMSAGIEDGSIKYDDVMAGLGKIDELGNAETSEDVSARMVNEITKIAKTAEKRGGGNVFIVSHGGAIGDFISGISEESNYNIDNAV